MTGRNEYSQKLLWFQIKVSDLQKQCSGSDCEKGVLKNFTMFLGKHLSKDI